MRPVAELDRDTSRRGGTSAQKRSRPGGEPIGDLTAFKVAGEAEVGSAGGDDHCGTRASPFLRKKDGERWQIGRIGARYLGCSTAAKVAKVEMSRAGSRACARAFCAAARPAASRQRAAANSFLFISCLLRLNEVLLIVRPDRMGGFAIVLERTWISVGSRLATKLHAALGEEGHT